MEKRIIPWIKKKLIEIIGEDEPTLVEFVSTRLKHKTKPEYILQEIKIALGKFFTAEQSRPARTVRGSQMYNYHSIFRRGSRYVCCKTMASSYL